MNDSRAMGYVPRARWHVPRATCHARVGLLAAGLVGLPGVAFAHDSLAHAAIRQWTFDPLTVALLGFSSILYLAGVRRAWRQGGRGAGFRWWQVVAFAGAIGSLTVALVSPVAWLSDVLFSVHMTQHEILMLISAPLLVVGQPLLAYLWAVPAASRAKVAAMFRGPRFSRFWHALTGPLIVFALHAVAVWIWHVPALFEAALRSEAIHAFQHFCFFSTAVLFWWGMVYGRYGRLGYGVAIVYVFMTALHSTILGALLTIAPQVWYPAYASTAAQWQLDALADQQLAGLIMWVPSGMVFVVVGLALMAAWLGESERRARLGRAAALDGAGDAG